MALGGMMIAGSAAPAAAASHVDFTGYYRVNYMMDVNRGLRGGDAPFTDSYFDDRLLIDMTYSPTDEISVHWQLRGPNRTRWGGGSKNLATQHIYGEVKQYWGTVLVGRLDDGLDVYGLAALGYQPGFGPYQNYGPFDRADVIDAVRYSNNWDNGFGLMLQYGKLEADLDDRSRASDGDFDRIQAEASYFWDGGGASLGFMFDRDAAGPYHGLAAEAYWKSRGRTIDKTYAYFVNPAFMHSWGEFSMHFEGMAGWGTAHYKAPGLKCVNADADGYGAYLDFDYNYGPGNVNLAAWWVSGSDLGDGESGSLVDLVGGNFYPLLVAYGGTGNGKFRSGGSTGFNNDAIGIANNGYDNFIASAIPALRGTAGGNAKAFLNRANVFLGFYNATGDFQDTWGIGSTALWTNNHFDSRSFNKDTDANHWAISLNGTHAINEDISLHYAAAYLALNNPNYRVVNKASYSGNTGVGGSADTRRVNYKEQDKDLGFEFDFGVQLKLLDNLSLTTSVGYMVTGDAYKELRGYTVGGPVVAGQVRPFNGNTIAAKWRDADDVIVWYNTLQFDF